MNRRYFFLFILVAPVVWNQAGGRGKKLNFGRDFDVPGSNLAWAPSFVSFSLCFQHTRAGDENGKKKVSSYPASISDQLEQLHGVETVVPPALDLNSLSRSVWLRTANLYLSCAMALLMCHVQAVQWDACSSCGCAGTLAKHWRIISARLMHFCAEDFRMHRKRLTFWRWKRCEMSTT